MMEIIMKSTLFCAFLGLLTAEVIAAEYYASPAGSGNGRSQNSPFRIADFWPVAKPGDTLLLLDGRYTGEPSMLNPPEGLKGAPGKPITVKALNDGKVELDGEGRRVPVRLYHNAWFILEGFNAHHSSHTVVGVSQSEHNVVRRVCAWEAADGNTLIFGAHHSQHNLFEDCAGWGTARKIFSHSQKGDYTTFRRCWGRWEGSHAVGPKCTFSTSYNTHHGILENCIGTWDTRKMKETYVLLGYDGKPFVNKSLEKYSKPRTYTNYGIDQPYSVFRGVGTSGVREDKTKTHDKLLGCIAYVTGSQKFDGGQLYLWSPTEETVFRDCISFIQGHKKKGYSVSASRAGGLELRDITSIGAHKSTFDKCATENIYEAETGESLVSKYGHILRSSNAANVWYRYENGKLTNKPLWPWPMNQRIIDATKLAGYHDTVDVTKTVFELAGGTMPNFGANQSKQPPFYEDKTALLKYIDEAGKSRPITTEAQWRIRRDHIVANMQLVMGAVPDASFRVPLDVKVVEEVKLDHYTRKKITYNVEPHDRVESYLLVPHNLQGKTPAILALHQTGLIGKDEPVGLEGNAQMHYAKELAERGYIVIAPDYWPMGHYGRKKYNPYENGYASGSIKGVWNHMRAIDVLESLPEVDAARIGSIGHSLGGYNTVFLAALDLRVKAMVSSAGYNSFFDYASSEYGGGDLANWSLDKHIRRIRTVYNDEPHKVPVDFTELVGALAPRPFFTNAPTEDHIFVLPGVIKCIDAARPVYELLGAADNLQSVYPDAKHDFPDAQRQAAYEFFDRHLGSGETDTPAKDKPEGKPRRSFDLRERKLFEQLDDEEQKLMQRSTAMFNSVDTMGPLRVHPDNPRYFTDGSGKAVYLAGHQWFNDLQHNAWNSAVRVDWAHYLDFMEQRKLNYLRSWIVWSVGDPTAGHPTPLMPFKRTGPGNALDGKPRFDLHKFNPAFFERLRAQIGAAEKRGIYVSVMLFEVYGFMDRDGTYPKSLWAGNVFHGPNNTNGIDTDENQDGHGLEFFFTSDQQVRDIQRAYVKKAIDTVNEFDNVFFEIANELEAKQWQYEMIRFVKEYEATKPKQHLVYMSPGGRNRTGLWSKLSKDDLIRSPADVYSVTPGWNLKYRDDPPIEAGGKPVFMDMDHIAVANDGDNDWNNNPSTPWKLLTRGYHQCIYDHDYWKPATNRTSWEATRHSIGMTVEYAKKMDLAHMHPRGDLASTRYCLANPGKEYLVYLPDGGEVTVELSAASGRGMVEWFNPRTGIATSGGAVPGGTKRSFQAPFDGDAVLYLQAQ